MSSPHLNVEEVFLLALEKTPAERPAFLMATCADSKLRTRVEALLKAHDTAGDFLDSPALRPASSIDTKEDGACASDPTSCSELVELLAPCELPDRLGQLAHYEIFDILGRGGMGIVLRGLDVKLNRVVAIKVLAPQLAANAVARRRFLREAQTAAAVRHIHVVDIHAVDEVNGLPYLVMEYVSGSSLQQKIDGGALPLAEILRLGIQIASGLAAAHAQGLVHRDIKPANILLEKGIERVKITDFGLARSIDDVRMTQAGAVYGTPQYMSPEQAQGERVDQRSDLFSLGSVLYAMCTGRPPFRGETGLAVLRRVCDDTPWPIEDVNPDIPAALVEIVNKLMAKNPDARFQSAGEVGDLLGQCQSEQQRHGQVESPGDTLPLIPKAASAVQKFDPGEASKAAERPPHGRRWVVPATTILVLLAGLGLTEATGLTNLRGSVSRLFSPDGTLVVEVDDPGVSVSIDGGEPVLTRMGTKEIRLKPGDYKLVTSKDGRPMRQELVTVTDKGRVVVRVSKEGRSVAVGNQRGDPLAGWVREVVVLPAEEQVKAVVARLKDLNPGFDGQVTRQIEGGVVTQVVFVTDHVTDITPLRALTGVTNLFCTGSGFGRGQLTDLEPLRGMRLTHLSFFGNKRVADLSPLAGMKLTSLNCSGSAVTDLEPLRGMPLQDLDCQQCQGIQSLAPLQGMPLKRLDFSCARVSDLTPLHGMKLDNLCFTFCPVADLSPLRGMNLTTLSCMQTKVTDLAVLRGMPLKVLWCDFQAERDAAILRSIASLETINNNLAAALWKVLDAPPPAKAPFNAQQARDHQKAWAMYLGVPVVFTNKLGMKFQLIPPGEFTMGVTEAEAEAWEKIGPYPHHAMMAVPTHRVKLTRPFYLAEREVRYGDFLDLMKREPGDHPKHPDNTLDGAVMAQCTWFDCIEFCNRLSEREERTPAYHVAGQAVTLTPGATGYRLPTEAEWEFACRAGTTSLWHFGWTAQEAQAMYAQSGPKAEGYLRSRTAGPNPFGLLGIYAGASEWCWDRYDSGYYRECAALGVAFDPQGPDSGQARITRGGTLYSRASGDLTLINSAARNPQDPKASQGLNGFGRVVLPIRTKVKVR